MNERLHGTTYATRAEVQDNVFECIKLFYNRGRRLSTLSNHSPVRLLETRITSDVDPAANAACGA